VEVYPPKLVLAAVERDVRKGLLDYGVSAARPWLTEQGQAFLAGIGGPPLGPILKSDETTCGRRVLSDVR